MACFHPLKGYMSREYTEDGRRKITFSPRLGYTDMKMEVPCGKCIGCLLERSRMWAVRCVHEASLYKENCFLTLTYSPENLPPGGSLRKRDFVNFIKRLRKHIYPTKIRFFQCGEYGEKLDRPHYHCLIFGWEPAMKDRLLWKKKGPVKLWSSPLLERLWGHGYIVVGDVTFESAAYIARYVLKKVSGAAAASHYGGRVPEYLNMSRRPGLGLEWFKKYRDDVYPGDDLIYGLGKITRPPRYYDKIYARDHPEEFKQIVNERILRESNAERNEEHRLIVREKVALARMKWLERELEINK